MKHQESKLQRQAVKWFRLQYPNHVLFHIPNGGMRSKTEASIMKAEGVVAGVPDLFLAYSNYGYNGLFIEMKTPKGRITNTQEYFMEHATRAGYLCAVCRSLDDFMELVNNYLKTE